MSSVLITVISDIKDMSPDYLWLCNSGVYLPFYWRAVMPAPNMWVHIIATCFTKPRFFPTFPFFHITSLHFP